MNARWKITVELVSNDGEGDVTTTVTKDGRWTDDSDYKPLELIGMDCGAAISMLGASGAVCGGVSTIETVLEAASEGLCWGGLENGN